MSKITKAFATVSGLTILSRVLGFAREVLTAQILGAGAVADAFFVALRLPNFLRQIFAEGALSVAFVPMMSVMLAEDKQKAKRFAESTLAWLIVILIPFCVLMVIFMPNIIPVWLPGDIYAPGTERFVLSVEMARITYPLLVMISCVALMGGVLNSLYKFVPMAAAPCIFNVVITIFLIIAWVHPNWFQTIGHAMAVGISVSGILQVLWMNWFLRRANFQLGLRLPTVSPEIKKLLLVMLPAAFAGSITQIDLLLGQTIASLLPGGTVSYLYYAERLNQLPLGILGVAAGTALLPMLARSVKENKLEESKHLLSRTIEFCLFLGLPTAIAFLILAEPIQITLFQRGEFTMRDAHLSSFALMSMAVGIPAFVAGKAFVTVLFAHQDTKAAVRISAITAATSTGLGFLFVQLSKHFFPENIDALGVVSCALSTSIAGWVNLFLLLRVLHKQNKMLLDGNCARHIRQMLLAAAAMGLCLLTFLHFLSPFFYQENSLYRLLSLGVICGSGGAVYVFLCFRLGALKWDDVRGFLRKDSSSPLRGEVAHEV